MVRAQGDSIRLLKTALVAAVVLPLAFFACAAWLIYWNTWKTFDDQIGRGNDVVNEHALKVFESVERTIAEVNEIIRDMSDVEIEEREAQLHERLRRLAEGSSQVKSLWIFDRHGRALVNSLTYPSGPTRFADRDYFSAHVAKDVGVYVGQVLRPRPPFGGAPFFGVSGRRLSKDGEFAGVIQASILPDYFETFYAKLARNAGGYFSLIREDGLILARYPNLGRDAYLVPNSPLVAAMRSHPAGGIVTLVSAIDGVSRKVQYRKLESFPVFVLSGAETAAVRNVWLSQIGNQLLFGVPATAALIWILLIALRRTRRLYAEAAARQAAEEALKQAQRLEALGQLTGGVAHDFNNLLMVVGGSAQKLKFSKNAAERDRALGMIDAAVERGSKLTRRLLTFSRRQNILPVVIDLAESVRSFLDLLKQTLPANVVLRLDSTPEPMIVKIDKEEFEIAMLNIALNARDAMPDGGTLSVRIAAKNFDQSEQPEGLRGKFAEIAFSDTGEGIPDDVRPRIFEPFFTTKAVNKGTGLGLSQVYGFAKQAGGSATVESLVGKGTTIRVLIPIAEGVSPPVEREVPAPIRRSGNLTVLLVEDNPDVAIVAANYFEQCGCTVLRAESAEAAVDLLNKRKKIDLLFSDIMMPGMSGLELGRLVRDHYPQIRVLLTSGYSDQASLALAEGFTLLNKPYSLDTLRNMVFPEARPSAAE